MSRSYPFTSRAEVARLLATDANFVRRAFALLADRTATGSGGFMASHRSKARALAPLLDELVDGELLERAAWMTAYAKTLSRVLREEQIAADPALRAKAMVFGIVTPTIAPSIPPKTASVVYPEPAAEPTATANDFDAALATDPIDPAPENDPASARAPAPTPACDDRSAGAEPARRRRARAPEPAEESKPRRDRKPAAVPEPKRGRRR